MQIIKRVMSNFLLEGMSKNRIRASMSHKVNMDPARAEILGKTLGELQDYRDLAHDESLKTEQAVQNIVSEKRPIRDRIAEMKAKIEYKKHLLDKTRLENKSLGRQHEGFIEIEEESNLKSKAATRALFEDTKQQLELAYKLRDKLLTSDSRGTTINPQVKLRIEERMTDLENKVDQDIESNHRVAANLEENLGHAQRVGADYHARIEETKYTLGEIKKESEEIDKDIIREIGAKNKEISNDSTELKRVLKEKQDLKWKIGSLESEVNRLEFEKSKLDVEYDVRGLKDNKYDLIDALNRRIEDAKYNEQHIRSLCHGAKDINIDIDFLDTMDINGDRNYRLQQLRDDLEYKKKNEEQTRQEIRALNDKLRSIGEVHFDTRNFESEEEYASMLIELNKGYNDVVQSVKDHITANAAILRKEREIKEMEARIALIDLDALEEEYQRLRIQYDRDTEILRDLEERYSLIHDRLIRLRARLRELNDLIRSLEERLETARFEIEDAERKYKLIKVPKKIEYIINERSGKITTEVKTMEYVGKISEEKFENERRRRTSRKVSGKKFYRISQEELDSLVPIGSEVPIYADKQDGYYRYGAMKISFIKGDDGEYYVNYQDDVMTFDDFISLYEAQEKAKSRGGFVQGGTIDNEEATGEVGDEEINRNRKKKKGSKW
jgi:chromosome segregation ATPase